MNKTQAIYIQFRYPILFFTLLNISNCKKLVNVPSPVNTITTSQVFSTDDEATSAISGIYSNLINTYQPKFSSGILTIYLGLSSDEFHLFNKTDLFTEQFETNKLLSTNGNLNPLVWTPAFQTIYSTNAIISNVETSSGIHDSVKNELIGEAEFVRAFCNFYLVNIFGKIPLVTTIDYNKTNLLARSDSNTVYTQIISDLKDAQLRLSSDLSVGNGEKIIPNKWAATALLSRVYLYLGRWKDAEMQATSVINKNDLYSLAVDPNSVFLANSSEAIWQLKQSNAAAPYNATVEGAYLIPKDSLYQPYIYLSSTLLNNFENGDTRRNSWIDSTTYNGIVYYYPFKYKIGPSQESPNGSYSEYFMVLRLAEQYLIRAEARAQQTTNLAGAVSDLNAIRIRAGLTNLSPTLTVSQTLFYVMHERQNELFAEWGHRWLDLKRIGQATKILSLNKGYELSTNSLLYPIPVTEVETDPNLTQNEGY